MKNLTPQEITYLVGCASTLAVLAFYGGTRFADWRKDARIRNLTQSLATWKYHHRVLSRRWAEYREGNKEAE